MATKKMTAAEAVRVAKKVKEVAAKDPKGEMAKALSKVTKGPLTGRPIAEVLKKSSGKTITRHAVKVGGKEYGSTFQAFKSLRLPIGRHVRFRKLLKAAGKATFEAGKRTFQFQIVKA